MLFIITVCHLTDGSALIGCSELTGRYWNGGVNVFRDINAAQEELKDVKKTVYLTSGTPDGCFVVDSTKVSFHHLFSVISCFNNTTQRIERNYLLFMTSWHPRISLH